MGPIFSLKGLFEFVAHIEASVLNFRFSYRTAVLELIFNFAPLPNTPSYYFYINTKIDTKRLWRRSATITEMLQLLFWKQNDDMFIWSFDLKSISSTPSGASFPCLGAAATAVPWSRSWEQKTTEHRVRQPASLRGFQPQDEHEAACKR